jgi:hypothetical protein
MNIKTTAEQFAETFQAGRDSRNQEFADLLKALQLCEGILTNGAVALSHGQSIDSESFETYIKALDVVRPAIRKAGGK